MTREMNKPDWHSKWLEWQKAIDKGYTLDATSIPRILDEDWKPFVDELNKRLENKQ